MHGKETKAEFSLIIIYEKEVSGSLATKIEPQGVRGGTAEAKKRKNTSLSRIGNNSIRIPNCAAAIRTCATFHPFDLDSTCPTHVSIKRDQDDTIYGAGPGYDTAVMNGTNCSRRDPTDCFSIKLTHCSTAQ